VIAKEPKDDIIGTQFAFLNVVFSQFTPRSAIESISEKIFDFTF